MRLLFFMIGLFVGSGGKRGGGFLIGFAALMVLFGVALFSN